MKINWEIEVEIGWLHYLFTKDIQRDLLEKEIRDRYK